MAPAMIASHSATSLDAHLLRRRNPIPASPAAASHALSAAAGRSCQLAGSRRSAAARPGGSSLLVRRFRENDTEVDLVTDVKINPALGPATVRHIPGLSTTPAAALPTVFRLGHHCAYGLKVAITGDVQQLGGWDTDRAVPMQWSEGDVWTAAVNLPNSATVAYRYLVLDKAGRVVEGAQLAEEEQGGGEMQLQVRQGATSLHGCCTEVMEHLPPALLPFLHGRPPALGSSLLPAVFRLAHHCQWGEHYGLLGSVEQLGNWDPAKAVPMKWGTNDMWTVAVPLPPGQEVQYKFVLLSEEGAMLRYCEETTPPGYMNHAVVVHANTYRLTGSSARVLPHLPPHLRRYMVAMPAPRPAAAPGPKHAAASKAVLKRGPVDRRQL